MTAPHVLLPDIKSAAVVSGETNYAFNDVSGDVGWFGDVRADSSDLWLPIQTTEPREKEEETSTTRK